MEHSPERQPMTKEEILSRLGEIDKKHFTLTENLNRVPGQFQESNQGDDDAVEAEPANQAFGAIRQEIETLERERDELHARLAQFQKAA